MFRQFPVLCMAALLTLCAAFPAMAGPDEKIVHDPLLLGYVGKNTDESGAETSGSWDGRIAFRGVYSQGKWLAADARPVLVKGERVPEDMCLERKSDDEVIVAVSALLPVGTPLAFHAPDGTKIATGEVDCIEYDCTDMDGMELYARIRNIAFAKGAEKYSGPVLGRLPSGTNIFLPTEKKVSATKDRISFTATGPRGQSLEMRFAYVNDDGRDTYQGTLIFDGTEIPSLFLGYGEEPEDKDELLENARGYFIDLNGDGIVEFIEEQAVFASDGKEGHFLFAN